MSHESNLLCGVYAVKLGLTTPDKVIEAATSCLDSQQTIVEYLVDAGELSSSSAALLLGLLGGPVPSDGSSEMLDGTDSAPGSGNAGRAASPGVIEVPGRYVNEREYARGGMGRVILVHDRVLGRDVALKEILPEGTSGNRHTPQSDLERRFVQEARITGQLEHPSIVPLYELGHRPNGRPYYVMKLVQGRSLREVIRSSDSLNERLKLLPRFLDLCQAVAYAHSRGILHRDIKSENVLLGQFGETAVIDWGLAKSRHDADDGADNLSETMRHLRTGDVESAMKTAYGSALGTPAYMAPEQAAGELERIDERSDIYSLGVVLFEILTGQVPFNASSLTDAITMVIEGQRRPVDAFEPNAPPELVRICDRATHRDPDQRYQSASALVEDVESFHNVWQADESLREAYRELQDTHDELQHSRRNELRALDDARLALSQAERDLYLASIQLAANRVSEHRYDLARGALAEAPERERRWEWGYLVGRAFPHMLDADWDVAESEVTTGLVAERWRGAAAREIFSVKAHDAYVTGVVTDENRTMLLTSSADGTGRLWRFPTAEPLGTFSEGADVVQGAALTHDGLRVATTRTYHSGARIWDVSSGAPLFELSGHKEPVGEIRFGPGDARVVTASADHTAKLWDASSGALLATFSGHEAPVFDAVLTPDGSGVVTASADGTIRTWDVGTKREVARCTIPADRPIVSMRLSACLRACLCAFNDGTGGVYDVPSEALTAAHTGRIGRLDKSGFSADATCFIAPESAGGAAIRDSHSGELLATVGDRHEILHAAVFDHSGSVVFTGAVDGTVKAWTFARPESLKPRGHLRGHGDAVYYGSFSPDSARVVTASYDQAACVWEVATGELIARLSGHSSELQSAVFTADGRFVVTGSWDLTRIVWDAHTYEKRLLIEGKRTSRKAEFFGGARSEYNLGNSAILGQAVGPDSRVLLVRDNQLSHDAWDITTGEFLFTLGGHTKPLTTQAFSRDGRYAVTGSMSGESIVWDLQSGAEVRRLRGHRAGVTFADFSPDGSSMVTSSLDRTAIVWDLASGESRVVLRGHGGLVKTARFSPCGTQILTSSVDTTAIVWDAQTGARLATLIGHRGRMLDASFSPDGSRVLTADYEMARVWDREGHELVALPADDTVLFATWSPNGSHIVTCHKDGSALVSTAIGWEELAALGGERATLEQRLQLRRERLQDRS